MNETHVPTVLTLGRANTKVISRPHPVARRLRDQLHDEERRRFCGGAQPLQLDQPRDATINEYGCEVFEYVEGSKEHRHTVTPNLKEINESGEDIPSVYEVAMKLRAALQIAAEEEAEADPEEHQREEEFEHNDPENPLKTKTKISSP